MKKQSASTIKLFSIDDINKRDAIEKLKAVLIGIGLLRYMPENEDKKTPPQKRGCIKSF
ncbi:MAG: hypothetical protein VW988_02155 [Gammaproteobacteria bacterium]